MRVYYCAVCQEEHYSKVSKSHIITDDNFHGEKTCKQCKKQLKESKKHEKQ